MFWITIVILMTVCDSEGSLDTDNGHSRDDTTGNSIGSASSDSSFAEIKFPAIRPLPYIPLKEDTLDNRTSWLPRWRSAERRWTRYAGGVRSLFWHRCAYCLRIACSPTCEQIYKVMKPWQLTHKYVANWSDAENTNIEEQNPLKCHFMEIWTNTTEAMPIYSFCWTKESRVTKSALKVSGNYVVKVFTLDDEEEEDSEFTCGMAMNVSFPRAWYSLFFDKTWDPIGIRYNEREEGFREYDYGEDSGENSEDDSEYESSKEEDKEEEEWTGTNPCDISLWKKGVEWRDCDTDRVHPVKFGIPYLPSSAFWRNWP